ncbi:MAG: PIN domain-containing protein [Cyclobacteriaceae bacterium]
MSSSNRVLVDSSVWIEFFRGSTSPNLDRLIEEDLICTNDIILTELIPSLIKNGNKEAANSLLSIHRVPLDINWDIIREYQVLNLKKGINKVGIADLIIIQQVIFDKLTLHTLDKHFQLMQKHLNFETLNTSL